MSTGEALGEEIYQWARNQFGVDVNEMCGQTEFNYGTVRSKAQING